MTWLVDANVLSEATKPRPHAKVVEWLQRHESEIVVDPIVLGEIHGLTVVTRNSADFQKAGVSVVNPFA